MATSNTSTPDGNQQTAEQFLSTADDYFRSELKLVTSDYDCLGQMNSAALDKYNQMHRQLQRVNNSIRTMNDNNATKISANHGLLSDIEDAMSNLESTIMSLDAYSRSLENQVKKFEKTSLANRIASPSKD